MKNSCANPYDDASSQIFSITNDLLDYDLPNISQTMKDNYIHYLENVAETGTFVGIKLPQFYVTPGERESGESIEIKNKKQIKEEICKLILQLEPRHSFDVSVLKTNTAKDRYIEFYYEVIEALEDNDVEMLEDEEEEDDYSAYFVRPTNYLSHHLLHEIL